MQAAHLIWKTVINKKQTDAIWPEHTISCFGWNLQQDWLDRQCLRIVLSVKLRCIKTFNRKQQSLQGKQCLMMCVLF